MQANIRVVAPKPRVASRSPVAPTPSPRLGRPHRAGEPPGAAPAALPCGTASLLPWPPSRYMPAGAARRRGERVAGLGLLPVGPSLPRPRSSHGGAAPGGAGLPITRGNPGCCRCRCGGGMLQSPPASQSRRALRFLTSPRDEPARGFKQAEVASLARLSSPRCTIYRCLLLIHQGTLPAPSGLASAGVKFRIFGIQFPHFRMWIFTDVCLRFAARCFCKMDEISNTLLGKCK